MSLSLEDTEIVIIGAGICGLATALALHRKGIGSVVLERDDCLRATGAGIAIYSNGWRALDQLGLGPTLRERAIPICGVQELWLDKGMMSERILGKEELRCLLRSDLIQALYDGLPPGTVRFGCHFVSVKTDPETSHSLLHFHDGSVATAKILIGCDGVNSVVAESLKLKPPRNSPTAVLRGLTNYPNGHGLGDVFSRTTKGCVSVGRIPIDDKLLYWFVTRPWLPQDSATPRKPELIKQAVLEATEGFPSEIIEMVENSEDAFLNLSRSRYRAPWDLLVANFRRGMVTVAGDAMHMMGPFTGQGGSASLEDAVVLARCLAEEMRMSRNGDAGVVMAMDKYVKERRMRVTKLSMQTYLVGLLVANPSMFFSGLIIFALQIFFGGPLGAAQYDCGTL